MARWFRFLLVTLIGIAVGLLYGWVINPVEYIDTTPDTLRVDYKTDYVLMVAEVYASEQDTSLAVRRLAQLGDDPTTEMIRRAILFAEEHGYSDIDLRLMHLLSDAVSLYQPGPETPAP